MPQSYSGVLVQVVFSTKHREPRLTPAIRERIHPYMAATLRNLGCQPLQVGGVEDHVHMLFVLSRTVSIADVVQKTKTSSSRWLKTKDPEFSWQSGYGAFPVGRGDVALVVRYIQNQVEHHRKTSFQDEYIEMLGAAGIPYDEKYMSD